MGIKSFFRDLKDDWQVNRLEKKIEKEEDRELKQIKKEFDKICKTTGKEIKKDIKDCNKWVKEYSYVILLFFAFLLFWSVVTSNSGQVVVVKS
jgi:hypothetical protein